MTISTDLERIIAAHDALRVALNKVRDQNTALRFALRRYGRHDATCPKSTAAAAACLCGYEEAIAP